SDGVYFVDTERRITYWNAAAERVSGYPRQEMLGHRCPEGGLLHCDASGKVLCQEGCPLEAVLHGNQPETCQVFLRCKSGNRVPVIVSAAPVLNNEGIVVGVAEVFRENTAQVLAVNESLEAAGEAYQDPLTRIGNRRFAELHISRVLQQPYRQQRPGALLFLDVDHFKEVNDTYGHLAGDAVLKAVAQTICRTVRSVDLVCRWGGEEFLILLAGVSAKEMLEVAERCRALVAKSSSMRESGYPRVTCSIGAALLSEADTMESLLQRADAAMYQAKRQGRDRVCVAPREQPHQPSRRALAPDLNQRCTGA
nr:sensor domain-containing diguanylate cyclase [Bryobacterales bacterium]